MAGNLWGADVARFSSEWNSSHRALIQKTASALKAESKRLLTHAEQQEKASNAATGAGALGGAGGGWAVVGGAAVVGGIRAAMGVQKNIKAPLTLAKHVGQYGWVLKNRRAEMAQALLTKGRHRLGGQAFDNRHLWQTNCARPATCHGPLNSAHALVGTRGEA